MNVLCPHCSKTLSVPDAYKGQKIRCKDCDKPITANPIQPEDTKPVISPLPVQPHPEPKPQKGLLAKNRPRSPVSRARAISRAVDIAVIIFAIMIVLAFANWLRISRLKKAYLMHIKLWHSQPAAAESPPMFFPSSPKPQTAPLPPGSVLKADWKVISKHPQLKVSEISWQVKYFSYFNGTVDIAFSFYDANGFLLHKSDLYTQSVLKGKSYTFTNSDILTDPILSKVASHDAKVRAR